MTASQPPNKALTAFGQPGIIPLQAAAERPAGGKAEGLARLIELQLRVPPGFVVVGAAPGRLPSDLADAYRALGEPRVAVRSSAAEEDGALRSFAGQYETVLDVQGQAALREAVERCLASLESHRARAYQDDRTPGSAHRAMSVVVQRMVSARAAGVVFTVDPVSGRRQRVVVDAVPGLGEKLVSGQVTPDHFELDRQGTVQLREPASVEPVLHDAELAEIVREALQVERAVGGPMDLEWAIDQRGRLNWLQARPITTLTADPQEFNTPCRPDDVFTLANTGEMMPGAVGPLTISTTVRGIDHGVQDLLVRCGARDRVRERLTTMGLFHGHIFFNLSAMLPMCQRVAGSTSEQLGLAICGRVVPELGSVRPASALQRAANGVRYAHYVLSQAGRVRRLEAFLRTFHLPPRPSARQAWEALDEALPVLDWTYRVHMQSSAGSGVTSGMLQAILSGGRPITPEQEATLAGWLAGATGVESATLVFELDRLVDTIWAVTGGEAAFGQGATDSALAWLRSPSSGPAGRAFTQFLERHGHRSFRELDMRQPCWEDDPTPLVSALQTNLRVRGQVGSDVREPVTVPIAQPSNKAIQWLLARARDTVRNREYTKSILVDVTNRFKRAYRRLGEQMAAEGLLTDADAVYFLTHSELGAQVQAPAPARAERAVARRKAYALQQGLVFPEISVGPMAPLEPGRDGGARVDQPGVLQGKPVSRGVAEGVVRVVRTLEEAAALRPGEILVAPVTDVGWTPYFRIIGGLATDVGSAISHGAVVAREYGLPAVVNLRDATRRLRTGQRIRLDGNLGTVTLLDAADP